MSSRRISKVAGAVAWTIICGVVLGAMQDVSLQYRWTKGEALRYRITQVSATAISGLPGGMGDMTIDQSTTQVFRTVAEDVAPDGTVTLRQVVESIKMDMNSPMFTASFDSANPDAAAANPMSGMLKTVLSPMIGASFTLVMASTGEVQKVEGLSALADKVFKTVAQDPAAAGVLDGLKANLSDDAMRSMMSQTFTQFPNRPLKPGDTWSGQVSASNPMLGTLVTTVSSTLKAVEGAGSARIARIATSVSIKQDASKPVPSNPMGMTMQLGDSTGDGEQFFDAGTGRFQRSTINIIMPMTMSGAGPDGTPLNLKTNVKTTTTVELVK
jgi:Family of unknown function (DUF6263)